MHGDDGEEYQVLARKYRPSTFADLVGQDAMVRTLKNAFAADRIAQAFILTGIRGTGKTTTARIIAKGMNCIGPDGEGGPTTSPCGECDPCRAIAEGRHVDVLEMDAASHTGVGDIREIIDSVRYRAASARYKIYIIDEVHMLSTSAFNALLKTLEEPPAHVKFIFATTEIRKVPVTVLSRCQRFDLRRIEPEVMMAMLRRIADGESAQIDDGALALITRAAEGSARDATSLLDQAIGHGAGETNAKSVRAMLGLADRGRVLDLFEMIMAGDAAGALAELGRQYADGADPMAVMRDLAEITHWLSVAKIGPEALDDPTLAPETRTRGRELAEKLGMRALSRAWQMLLKALEEIAAAPNAMMAAEMAVIRLTHVADLPTPEDLVRKLESSEAPPAKPSAPPPVPNGGTGPAARAETPPQPPTAGLRLAASGAGGAALAPQPADPLAAYTDFAAVVALIRARRDMKLVIDVEDHIRLVSYIPGRIEFHAGPQAPADLAQRLRARLEAWTAARWAVSVASAPNEAETLSETRARETAARHATATAHPLVAAAIEAFPGATVSGLRTPEEIADEAQTAAQAAALEVHDDQEDGWDPFEDD
ncbi:MAG: DNA polymerase III subunit gamma/tau [Rhodobacteraceae bacterium]|nr:DNA polymerase III subunit gamma/tau [Paracoccaceae bacterium]